jgi:isopentenyldiphosphate isomerase
MNISNMSSRIDEGEPLIDVLDEFGIRTGESLTREQIHKFGKVHRAVHLYLFDETTQNLLLQRRSQNVDHYPNMFSISLTGHIDAGEYSMQALKREIKEELNLDTSNMKLEFLFSFRQDAIISPTYIDKQFNDVYACWHKFKLDNILFDAKDISQLKLVSFDEFKLMVESEKSELAPVYKRECADVVHFLRSKFMPK